MVSNPEEIEGQRRYGNLELQSSDLNKRRNAILVLSTGCIIRSRSTAEIQKSITQDIGGSDATQSKTRLIMLHLNHYLMIRTVARLCMNERDTTQPCYRVQDRQ